MFLNVGRKTESWPSLVCGRISVVFGDKCLPARAHRLHQHGEVQSNIRTGKRKMNKPVVLLVLDQPEYLDVYGAFLRDRGYETLLCVSPGQGLNLLENESISLVIVSQDTPAFEGRLVMERSLRLHPEVPVLVVARVLDMHCYLETMDHGATDYLERPEPADLGSVVETQLLRCAFA